MYAKESLALVKGNSFLKLHIYLFERKLCEMRIRIDICNSDIVQYTSINANYCVPDFLSVPKNLILKQSNVSMLRRCYACFSDAEWLQVRQWDAESRFLTKDLHISYDRFFTMNNEEKAKFQLVSSTSSLLRHAYSALEDGSAWLCYDWMALFWSSSVC